MSCLHGDTCVVSMQDMYLLSIMPSVIDDRRTLVLWIFSFTFCSRLTVKINTVVLIKLGESILCHSKRQ